MNVVVDGVPFRLHILTEAANAHAAAEKAEASVDVLLDFHAKRIRSRAAGDVAKFMADFWGVPNPEQIAEHFLGMMTDPTGTREKLNAAILKAAQHLTGGRN